MGNEPSNPQRPVILSTALMRLDFNSALQKENMLLPTSYLQTLQKHEVHFGEEYGKAVAQLTSAVLNASDKHHIAFCDINAHCDYLIGAMHLYTEEVNDDALTATTHLLHEMNNVNLERLKRISDTFSQCLVLLNDTRRALPLIKCIIQREVQTARDNYYGVFKFLRSRNNMNKLERAFGDVDIQMARTIELVEMARGHILAEINGTSKIKTNITVLASFANLPDLPANLVRRYAQEVINEAENLKTYKQGQIANRN